jgi:hypothetical protein
MVDVTHKTCVHVDENGIQCKTIPNFNNEGSSNPLYCVLHKLEGMVDVKNKMCVHVDENGIQCKTTPNFNNKGSSKPLYCVLHKLEGMINIKDKKCIYTDQYGIQCTTRPNYNTDATKKALYCNLHKLNGMVNVIHKTCKSEWCFTQVTDKYDGHCMHCYMHLFPDKPVSRNYKTKERHVIEHVTAQFQYVTWIIDKPINGGCSKRRPDLMLDLGYQIVIIEIDENQHMDYDSSCENKRIMELSQDVGHQPMVFIRFNPDEYCDENGKTISSCWGQNTQGIYIVKKSKKPEWEMRLNALDEQIKYWLNPLHVTNKTIEIVQLFYSFIN